MCIRDSNSFDFWNLEEEAWSLYFNEMYYVGGPESALDERTYELFWGNLSYKGEKVDVMDCLLYTSGHPADHAL